MTLLEEARDAFADNEPEDRLRLARLGAALFMAGSLTALPAGLFLEPPPKPYEHLISATGFLLGFILWRLPWTRMHSAWLHVFPIVGTLIVIAGVAVFSVVFSFFLVLAGMFVAISVRQPTVFSAYIAFLVFALFLPFTYMSGGSTPQAITLLATLPVLLGVALVSRYMHEVVVRQRDEYQEFAAQAIALGERIRGSARPVDDASRASLERRLRDLTQASSTDTHDWSSGPVENELTRQPQQGADRQGTGAVAKPLP